MDPDEFRRSIEFVFGSMRRAALMLGMHETTIKRMCGTNLPPSGNPQPIPPDLARRLIRAEQALRKIFPEIG
jgi:hypothetical protein